MSLVRTRIDVASTCRGLQIDLCGVDRVQARIDTACGPASAAAASNGAAAPRDAEGAASSVLVCSPHPDDDVISMGGTLAKLAASGLEARSYHGI